MKLQGITAPCPWCGQESDPIEMDLRTLGITCRGCDHEFTASQARDQARRTADQWARLAEWVAAGPGGGGRQV